MTKEEFISLCQEPPIYYTPGEVENLINGANLEEFDLSQLYSNLYSVYKCIRITESQAKWFDDFRARL